MSDKPKDGGPAFSTTHCHFTRDGNMFTGETIVDGMSLRDYFAGHALNGWAAGRNKPFDLEKSNPEIVAQHCYAYADAMLQARERKST